MAHKADQPLIVRQAEKIVRDLWNDMLANAEWRDMIRQTNLQEAGRV